MRTFIASILLMLVLSASAAPNSYYGNFNGTGNLTLINVPAAPGVKIDSTGINIFDSDIAAQPQFSIFINTGAGTIQITNRWIMQQLGSMVFSNGASVSNGVFSGNGSGLTNLSGTFTGIVVSGSSAATTLTVTMKTGQTPDLIDVVDTNGVIKSKIDTNFVFTGLVKPPSATATRAAVIGPDGIVTNALGTPDGTKFLRDDNTYATPPGSGGSSNFVVASFGTQNTTNSITASNFVATAGGTNQFGATVVTNSLGVGLNGVNNGMAALEVDTTVNSYVARFNTNTMVITNGNIGLATGTPRDVLEVAGGIIISNTGSGLKIGAGNATLTNTLFASATLDFPSTAAGAVSDLPITLAGASDGDVVFIGVPSAQLTGLTGDYFGWASNGVVYVRFANNNLVSAQDPASGTFKVRVDKFK